MSPDESALEHQSIRAGVGGPMTVSILIVNWNSKDLLRQCLLSIRQTCADLEPQIVVVENGSFDGCAEMITAEFPEVEFIQSIDNIGFGRANNLGLTHVTGDAVWVLNPDTEVRQGALQTLLGELERLPDAGILSPRFLNTDLTLQSSVHALPRPVRQAFDSEILRRALSPYALWAPPSDFAPPGTVAVEAVPGTAMLMRTETFRSVGGFTRRLLHVRRGHGSLLQDSPRGIPNLSRSCSRNRSPWRCELVGAGEQLRCRHDARGSALLHGSKSRATKRTDLSLGSGGLRLGPASTVGAQFDVGRRAASVEAQGNLFTMAVGIVLEPRSAEVGERLFRERAARPGTAKRRRLNVQQKQSSALRLCESAKPTPQMSEAGRRTFHERLNVRKPIGASQGDASLQPVVRPGHASIASIDALETGFLQLAQARCVVGAEWAGRPQHGSSDDRLDLATSLVDLHLQIFAIALGPGPMIHAMKADPHACGGHLSKLSRLQVAGLAEAAGEYEELGTKTAFRELRQRHLEVRLVSVIERETYLRKMGHALKQLNEEGS